MVFENGVKNIQAAAYNGVRTVVVSFLAGLSEIKCTVHVALPNCT